MDNVGGGLDVEALAAGAMVYQAVVAGAKELPGVRVALLTCREEDSVGGLRQVDISVSSGSVAGLGHRRTLHASVDLWARNSRRAVLLSTESGFQESGAKRAEWPIGARIDTW